MKNSISIVSLTAIATSSLLAVDIPSSAEPGRLEKRFEKPPTLESKPTKPMEEKKLEQPDRGKSGSLKMIKYKLTVLLFAMLMLSGCVPEAINDQVKDTAASYGQSITNSVAELLNALPFSNATPQISKIIITDIAKKNKRAFYSTPSVDRYLVADDYISDLTGNIGDGENSYFYINGIREDGMSFFQMIPIGINQKITVLLDYIKTAFDNKVKVSLDDYGRIKIESLTAGNKKIQFHIFASSNSTSLTKATAGLTAGSTVLTLASTSGIAVGDKLNIDGIGQVRVAGVNTPLANQITIASPLTSSAGAGISAANVKKVHSTNLTANAAIVTGVNEVFVNSNNGLSVGSKISLGDAVYSITFLTATSIGFNATSEQSVSTGDEVTFCPDASDMASKGVEITEFIKNSAYGIFDIASIASVNDYWNHSIFRFNTELKHHDTGEVSKTSDLLNTALGGIPTGITINGSTTAFGLGAGSTVGDLINAIQGALNTSFGAGNFSVYMDEANLVIEDKTILPANITTASSQLVKAQINCPSGTFGMRSGMEPFRVYVPKSGDTLSSSFAQIINTTQKYPLATDKIVDAAGASSLAGDSFTLKVTTVSGATEIVTISLGAAGSTFTVNSSGNVYNIINNESPKTTTSSFQITFQQLLDVISMATANIYPATVTPAVPTVSYNAPKNPNNFFTNHL